MECQYELEDFKSWMQEFSAPRWASADAQAIAKEAWFARARLDAMSEEGLPIPDAWLHTMIMDGAQKNMAVDFDEDSPWGAPGINHSSDYPVINQRLYSAHTVMIAIMLERLACAAIVEGIDNCFNPMTAMDAADAIRNRNHGKTFYESYVQPKEIEEKAWDYFDPKKQLIRSDDSNKGVSAPTRTHFKNGYKAALGNLRINAELIECLKHAIKQNQCDMLMTGEELRKCEAAIRFAGVQNDK